MILLYLCFMESIRQSKVARLLQKDLGAIFQEKTNALGSMITVTIVKVSPDLAVAKVYLSIFGGDKEVTLAKVKEMNWEIRKALGTKVRHQLRIVPELIFYLDDSFDYYEKIDKLLKE